MTTVLTLDTPEARQALAKCVRLLLQWANEDAADAQTLAGSASAAGGDDRDDRRQNHDTTNVENAQTEQHSEEIECRSGEVDDDR